jgi:hypothetical protein
MARTTVGSGVWNPGAPEPKHGDYRPGSFHVQGQVGGAMWQTAHQRWCASCKGWKPVAGVTGNLACPDCKATWVNPKSGKRKPVCCDACANGGCCNVGHELTLESCDSFKSPYEPAACDERCHCPLCQPYIPEN